MQGGASVFEYWVENVSATQGSDYTSSATQSSPGIIYYPGPANATLDISTSTDSANETTESFKIHIRAQGYPDSEIVLEADIFDANGPSLLKEVDYKYDAYNRMVRRTLDADGDGSGTATDTFYSNLGGQVALQFDEASASNLSHRYLWGPVVDQLLADEQVTSLSSAGTVIWPLADHLGTIRDLATHNSTTHATTIANHRVYDAFGNLQSETNSAIDEIFGFTGRQFDEATGLQYNLNRWYDPKTGRFLSEDPIGFGGGDTNLNRYVGNSPTSALDPSGLLTVSLGYGADLTWALIHVGGDVSANINLWPFELGVTGTFSFGMGLGFFVGFGPLVGITTATDLADLEGWGGTIGIDTPVFTFNFLSQDATNPCASPYKGFTLSLEGGGGWLADVHGHRSYLLYLFRMLPAAPPWYVTLYQWMQNLLPAWLRSKPICFHTPDDPWNIESWIHHDRTLEALFGGKGPSR